MGEAGIDIPDLQDIAIDILRAEIERRQAGNARTKPTCGTVGRKGAYNVPIHVFAVFLILTVSTLACAFPVIARRFPSLPIPHRFIFLSRHFGTGVLIATAFIHLLPTAFISMTDPCLPKFWNETYPPMPGFIAMLAVFAVVMVEQFFALRGAKHSHGGTFEEHDHIPLYERDQNGREGGANTRGDESWEGHGRGRDRLDREVNSTGKVSLDQDANTRGKNSWDGGDDEDEDEDPLEMPELAAESTALNLHKRHESFGQISNTGDQDPQKMFLQCLLLEAGILFHSIFIGMAVSVATGTAFVVLLIAICFHQIFEGFALGARIANLIPILFSAKSPKPWLMCLAYGATAPIGQVIGLLLHTLYDPNSEVGLLTVGITNAISSGLLLFAGLVQLVAEDFLADSSYKALKGRRRIEANLAVGGGGLLMAIVGAFA